MHAETRTPQVLTSARQARAGYALWTWMPAYHDAALPHRCSHAHWMALEAPSQEMVESFGPPLIMSLTWWCPPSVLPIGLRETAPHALSWGKLSGVSR